MRGRKGQPARVREAKGNPGKRAARPAKSTAAAARPAKGQDVAMSAKDQGDATTAVAISKFSGGVPRELTKRAKAVWNTLAPQLVHANVVRQTDRGALARYCDTVAEYWAVTQTLRRKKYTYLLKTIAGDKMPRLNPLFMVQDRLAKRLDALEDRFGLTPRSRQEILYRLAQAQAPQLPLDNPATGEPAPEPDSPVGFLNAGGVDGPTRVH